MIKALIDTGAIYALITRTDRHHSSAAEFTKTWVRKGNLFVLADLVFFETMTLIKRRLGASIALRVGQELRENPIYLWKALSPDLERATWIAFQKYRDKGWSYTDSALLVLAGELAIPAIFAFDEHFDQMPGIRRLP